MVDIMADLDTLSFESGLGGDLRDVQFLRARANGLAICGCAHAAFLCKLSQSLRENVKRPASEEEEEEGDRNALRVGILGMGRIGKQLLTSLLETVGIQPAQINISTRRPESSAECRQRGVQCYLDNGRLAAWADVLFLCCLPSQLAAVSADLRAHLPKQCLVYSFVTAVPPKRLANLLGHSFILIPQYDFVTGETTDMWQSQHGIARALKDPVLMEASCPLEMSGGLSLDKKWVCGVLYSLLNICTSASMGSRDTLALINDLFQLKAPQCEKFTTQSYISSAHASSLSPDEPFPWINLIDVHVMETPLSLFMSRSQNMPASISMAYKSLATTHTIQWHKAKCLSASV
ncbi:NADP-dependent oxidoreductase domain-containing protein 1 [Merluccius polli]|uniref:NADP-dependent oxidoreductase domain-containing protein 1 n=1 Tax=Merluccius polli TaxID=89951 RepID=A0AA47MA49_MERPO|nr:NADP-dependent oxidoreductase domain-containing protein 1 [Merluccius polli]KAK0139344.1 NADP-dependent oxidoreductase domain-containing protein 1 [Merluccius polli]